MENAAAKTLEQIEINHYDAGLKAHEVTNIIKLGVVLMEKRYSLFSLFLTNEYGIKHAFLR